MSSKDLDQGGNSFQKVRVYLGPSLGWAEEFVQPTRMIKPVGAFSAFTIGPGDSLILVDSTQATLTTTLFLPDVRVWVQQNANQPATAFSRGLTIKDFGGIASSKNIIITPSGQQTIDNIAQSIIISQNRGAVTLVPILDQLGWVVDSSTATAGGGGGGGGDVFKAGNNTFTGVNTFTNNITVPTQPNADATQNAASTEFVKNQNYITGSALLPYAPLFSPAFSGTPTAPTPAPDANDSTVVTVGFVEAALAGFSGGAPLNAEYVIGAVNVSLPAGRVPTNTATIGWDFSTPGQLKANTLAGGGNVSNSGTPTVNQIAQWVTSTSIKGIDISSLGFAPIADPTFTGDPKAPTPATGDNDTSIATTAYVKANLANYQPLDGDLTAISALLGTNTIYYRSATDIWSPVTFSGLTFSGGVLSVAGGSGNVVASGSPTVGQTARWTNATTIEGHQIYTGAGSAPSSPSPGDFWYDFTTATLSLYINDGNSSQWVQISPSGTIAPSVLRGYIDGLTMARVSTTSFSVSVGQAADTANTTIMILPSTITKTTAAWAVGNAGGRDTGASMTANSWYHVHLIRRSDTGVVDVLFSLSATAPTMPTNYNQRRRIGSFKVDASSLIINFTQLGDRFIWDVPVADVAGVNLTTTSALFPLTVPTGISVRAQMNSLITNSGAMVYCTISSPLVAVQTSNAPLGNISLITASAAGNNTAAQFNVDTDTSGRVRAVSSATTATTFYIVTTGWTDPRGKDS